MSRRLPALAVGVLVGASGVGALRLIAWPAICRREAARHLGALAGCLTGPERVSPEEAPVRARRKHPGHQHASAEACAEHADALVTSWKVSRGLPKLAALAGHVAEHLRGGRLDADAISALFREAEPLGYRPDPAGAAAPTPLLDTQIPALRKALPEWIHLHDSFDVHPFDRAVLWSRRALVIGRDAGGKALASPAWVALERPTREPRRPATTMTVPIDGRPVEVRYPAFRGSVEVTRDGVMRRALSCASREGQVLAIEQKDEVHVMLVREGSIERWGTFPMAHPDVPRGAGKIGITCGEGPSARLAWAESDPQGPVIETLRGRVERYPDARHRLFVVTCTPAGCARRREGVVHGLDTPWMTAGGWSSPWFSTSPEVLDLGERVLVVWQGVGAIKARLAPLDALDRAPSSWLVETHHDDEKGPLDPRRVGWARFQMLARGDAALVVVQEWMKDNASFVLRFDAQGEARVIEPPP